MSLIPRLTDKRKMNLKLDYAPKMKLRKIQARFKRYEHMALPRRAHDEDICNRLKRYGVADTST